MNIKKKLNIYVWLAMAVLSFFSSVHCYITRGFVKDTYVFFIFAFISTLMFFYKRSLFKLKEKE